MKKDCQGTEESLSEPLMLSQAAQVLVALVCRS